MEAERVGYADTGLLVLAGQGGNLLDLPLQVGNRLLVFLDFGLKGHGIWSVVRGQLSVVSCPWSVVRGQLSVVSCQLSVVRGQGTGGRGQGAGGRGRRSEVGWGRWDSFWLRWGGLGVLTAGFRLDAWEPTFCSWKSAAGCRWGCRRGVGWWGLTKKAASPTGRGYEKRERPRLVVRRATPCGFNLAGTGGILQGGQYRQHYR